MIRTYRVHYRELRYFTRVVEASDQSGAIDAVLADEASTGVEFVDTDITPSTTVEVTDIYRIVEDSE